jgi:hypothetical protein
VTSNRKALTSLPKADTDHIVAVNEMVTNHPESQKTPGLFFAARYP